MIELTGSRSRIRFEPLPHDDPRQRRPDITLPRKKLGWKPGTPLREGLMRTIAYFESQLRRTRRAPARSAGAAGAEDDRDLVPAILPQHAQRRLARGHRAVDERQR